MLNKCFAEPYWACSCDSRVLPAEVREVCRVLLRTWPHWAAKQGISLCYRSAVKPGLHGTWAARGLTPIVPIYLPPFSCCERESSCRIHGSHEHGARAERHGRVANGCFTPHLLAHG
jgi:hypothetical protein